ncbi:MAG: hypothetical protein VX252_07005, partial [Myxococcota bacterium]|nr:hypothetical protein [Myxococcota bacterium]
YGLQRQPYLRGNLLAHNWNARIIQASNREDNFDSLLKDWVGASRENGIDSHQIEALSRAFLDAGVMGDVRRHWLEGEVIEVDSDALGPCFALQEDEGIRQFQRQPEIALAEWNQRCNGPAPGWVIPQAEPSP